MFSWLKKRFIPHKGNDHRPYILRTPSIRSILVIVILFELITFFVPVLTRLNITGNIAAVLPSVLSMLTNEERQAQNLENLKVNPILNEIAEMKAKDMAALGYFSHVSPTGKTPWYWIEKAGYKYQYAGENLAINFIDSKDVARAWMESPTHKANIVKRNYTEIGTGIAEGIYEGRETVFVVQIYANPMTNEKVQIEPEREVPAAEARQEISNAGVLGAEFAQEPTQAQKLLASPRHTMNAVLFIVFGITLLALILNTFIKIKYHHPDLLTNGLIVLSVLGLIFLANYYWSHSNMVISTSMDYESGNR